MRRKQWSKAVASVTVAATMIASCMGSPASLLQVDAQPAGEYIYVDDAKLDEVLGSGNEVLDFTRKSVHDPSIVVSGGNYYVFGSHMGTAKTTDLRNWTVISNENDSNSKLFGSVSGGDVTPISYNQAFRNNAYTGKVTVMVNGEEKEVDFGTYDASSWNTDPDVKDDAGNAYNVQGNMWAPDVIFNPTMNKWCMYLSLNGAKWNSNIILLTADDIEGPYVYQGPVIYSGFNGTNALDISTTDLDLIYPDVATNGVPEKYLVGQSWGTLWPHAIDPCVSYDENGNLYLMYGSWSGGIYAIELDENTGLRDYTVVYPDVNAGQAKVTSDAYFGKKIAGGAYVSGEGAYVEKIGNYWYLFMSYGFYSPDGGYEMRIFRSDNIDGPYVDASGESAIFPSYKMNYGNAIAAYNGEKLMGGYQWETMDKGELSQGHNSAFTDANGNSYVVYHTKFNDGTAAHELRVHQLFVNEDGWLVAAPYEYTGETVNNSTLATTTFEASEIAGEYQVIVHKYEMNYKKMEIVEPQTIQLQADGTITGAYTGTWAVTTGSNVNIKLNDITYNGVLVEQIIDGTANKTLCFTAKNNAGVSIWGSRNLGDEYAIALTRDSLGLQNANNIFPVGGQIYQNVALPTTGVQDAVVTWTSSNEAVMNAEGVVTVPAQDTAVTMTCTITKGSFAYEKKFDVTVMGESSRTGDIESGLVAFFEFEGSFKDSLSDNTGVAEAQASGTAPSIKADSALGSQVVNVNFGFDGENTSNYVKFANPLKGSTTGASTVSMMVKRADNDVWDALWGFMDTDNSDGVDGRYYLTPNAYLGFNGTGGWFDANHPNAATTNAIPVSEWSLVTVASDATGFDIYVDGVLAYTEASSAAFDSGDFSDYASINKLVASADTFYLGYGSWWGSAPFRADDLRFYDRALTAADVAALYDDFLACFEKDEEEEGKDRSFAELSTYRTYYNDFEEGLGDATVVGNGEVTSVEDTKFNKVYQNATANIGVRSNYLLLPSDAISNASMAGNNELTIGFWVNPGEANVADYFFAPLFSAYGAAPGTKNTSPMMALQSRLLAQVNCAGWTDLTAEENVAGANKETNEWLADGKWHYYAASFTEETVTVYVDGEVMNQWTLDGGDGGSVSGLFTNGKELDYVCLGGNQAWDWADADAPYMYDQVAIFSTALTGGEIKNVMNERSLAEIEAGRTYFNDFEEGLGDATVVGNGAVETVENADYNKVYHNATANAGVRTNYLLLPSDAIAKAATSGSKEMSVGFWVNAADAADYRFAPLFTAYGDAPGTKNTSPMMALQSRLLAQVNCAGWTDLTAEENVAGANKETEEWLKDGKWHYYTASFTEETVTVYVDGEVMNQWNLSGGDGSSVSGLFTNGNELDYVCLGGNQAWDWTDKDASYMFDDVALYSSALTADDIAKIMAAKTTEAETPEPTPVPREDRPYAEVETFKTYFNDFEEGYRDTTQVGSGAIEIVEDTYYNQVYHNATGEKGVRKNYLLLPNDTIANAVNAGNEELSIGFWVNAADAADYKWTPMFAAYGDAPAADTNKNTWPMMILQSRLIGQVNCAGYSDFTDAENVAGANQISTAWLEDTKWHYYTATFSADTATIYVDGVVQNQWKFTNEDGSMIKGIFTNGNELDYVCLGGNQAWDWADNDASYMFDDVAVYSTVLSAQEIADVMAAKTADKEVKSEVSDTIPEAVLTDKVKEAIGGDTLEALSAYLKKAMQTRTEVTSVLPYIKDVNMKIVDVTMLVSIDGGTTWTPTNFVKDGVDVIIPYPETTNRKGYDFMVGHMITTGEKAGQMEFPAVTEVEEGLKVHVTSASPFIVGWKVTVNNNASKPVVTQAPTAAPSTGATAPAVTAAPATGSDPTSPKTYDDSVWFDEEKPVVVPAEDVIPSESTNTQPEEAVTAENAKDYTDYTNVDVAIGAGNDIAAGNTGLWLVVVGVMGVLAVAIAITASVYLKKENEEE